MILEIYIEGIMLYLLWIIIVGYLMYKCYVWFFKSVLVFNSDLTEVQKQLLETNVFYYTKLTTKEKQRFSKAVALFLSSIKIKAVSCTVTDVDELLIGSSAIIPVFGFPNWTYANLKEVYIFPDAFNSKLEYVGWRNNRNILGIVGGGRLKNKMVLSQKALRHGFENKSDKNNTAIHEFVHLIDMTDGDVDGLPLSIIDKPYTLPWFDLIHKKIEHIDDGKSDINPYGATSKIEFFAVASEYFFERPKLLKRKHPELYKKLSLFFNQDRA